MNRLGEDEHGLWLWSPPGTEMQRGYEPVKHSKGVDIKLIPADTWWTAIWAWDRPHDVYVDIITPARWEGSSVTMIDIDLDVVRWADGTVEILDEDEFADHQVRYDYPPRLVDSARATTARIALAVESHDEPFGVVAKGWMAKALELASTNP